MMYKMNSKSLTEHTKTSGSKRPIKSVFITGGKPMKRRYSSKMLPKGRKAGKYKASNEIM